MKFLIDNSLSPLLADALNGPPSPRLAALPDQSRRRDASRPLPFGMIMNTPADDARTSMRTDILQFALRSQNSSITFLVAECEHC
jgi:hypothetical protein